ncbi:MAG: GH32 C-terminal domain-containing protein, partial [Bacteroidota bacterium]|nr:GH32 C-terminal domain-containing protein [Bacteroidota bacterium]
YGPDEYAGITYSNTGNRKIFLGWMSNWQYGEAVPTDPWRSAMTIPRDLGLEKVGEKFLITSRPSPELNHLNESSWSGTNISASHYDLTAKAGKIKGPFRLTFTTNQLADFSLTLSNSKSEKIVVGFDKQANYFYIDRTQSGKTDFEKGFAKKHTAPRLSNRQNEDITLVVDNASIELFADNGLTTMTEIFFPAEIFSSVKFQSANNFLLQSIQLTRLKSIWKKQNLTAAIQR